MSEYMNLMNALGPKPEEARQAGQEALQQKRAIQQGAQDEIRHLEQRIKELKANPDATHHRPIESYECEPHVQHFKKVKDLDEYFEDVVAKVAVQLMANASDEAVAIQGYTKQIELLQCLREITIKRIEKCSKLSLQVQGPESTPKKDDDALIKKIEFLKKVEAWCAREVDRTKEKIKDELNHNASLIAAYTEFTGITPASDNITQVAKTIAATNPEEGK